MLRTPAYVFFTALLLAITETAPANVRLFHLGSAYQDRGAPLPAVKGGSGLNIKSHNEERLIIAGKISRRLDIWHQEAKMSRYLYFNIIIAQIYSDLLKGKY